MDGSKTIDLRNYALPSSLVGEVIGVLEKDQRGVKRLIGFVRFSGFIKYTDKWHWEGDYSRHLVRKRYCVHCENPIGDTAEVLLPLSLLQWAPHIIEYTPRFLPPVYCIAAGYSGRSLSFSMP